MDSARLGLPLALTLAISSAQADSRPLLLVANNGVSLVAAERRLERSQRPPRSGMNADEYRAHLVEHLLIPDLVFEHHAAQEAKKPDFRGFRNDALRQAIENAISESIQVSEAAVKKFYDEHSDRYNRPVAIHVWRILTANAEDAQRIITHVKNKTDGATRWGELARKTSLDAATKFRDGSLGFVREDGKTDVPQVRVSPSVYQAVSKLKDGQLSPEPVSEGSRYAVYWRRGTRKALRREITQERDNIRLLLRRKKASEHLSQLLRTLREKYVTEYTPDLIESVLYSRPLGPGGKPTVHKSQKAEGSPSPKLGDQGER